MSSPLKVDAFKKIKGFQLWAFTCKVNTDGKKADEKAYERFFRVLYRLSKVVTMCGEVDANNILHYHGCIHISNGLYRKKLCIKGYHMHLRRVYGVRGWIKYCHKHDVLFCFEDLKDFKMKKV